MSVWSARASSIIGPGTADLPGAFTMQTFVRNPAPASTILSTIMIGDFILVLSDLPVELIDQAVDRRIHVFLLILGKQLGAADLNGRLRFVTDFFDAENHMHIGDMIEVTLQFFEFRFNIVFQCFSHIEVMTRYAYLHGVLLLDGTNAKAYHRIRFLWLDDEMDIASRYFAMVLRATLMPRS